MSGPALITARATALIRQLAQALKRNQANGVTGYVEGDFRAPAAILKAAGATLDFSRPVAFMLLGHFGSDQEVSYVIRHLMRAAAPGSYLVIAHGSATSPGLVAAAEQYAASGAEMYHLRGPRQVRRFFEGLELVPPGVVPVPEWHPGTPSALGADGGEDGSAEAYSYCGAGRKAAQSS
jgi:hypothetical protein